MKFVTLRASLLLFCILGLAVTASAQAADGREDAGALLDRGSDELLVDLQDSTHFDRDVADTALVFSNGNNHRVTVKCKAIDSNGHILGRAHTHVPGNGLRYLLASDLSNGVDFVGTAVCRADGRADGSVIFLAPSAITSLKVKEHGRRGAMHFRFPVVASY